MHQDHPALPYSLKKAEMCDESALHLPVLAQETLLAIQPKSGQTILDLTLGRGGHCSSLLENGASVIAFDQDLEALNETIQSLAQSHPQDSSRLQTEHLNFRHFPQALEPNQLVDAIFMDIGVSSPQLDRAERGFSFQKDGPLDMRMNPDEGIPLSEALGNLAQQELTDIFRNFGEVSGAYRKAGEILERHRETPFTRTLELADFIKSISPQAPYKKGGSKKHPATQIFQALRIYINDELGALEEALTHCASYLKPDGILAIISFHSLEDRLVKRYMHSHSNKWIDKPEWPEAKKNPEHWYDLPHRKAIKASAEELEKNPRARSARLRVAIRNSTPAPEQAPLHS